MMVDIVSLLVNAEDHTTLTLAFSVMSQKQNMYHIVDYLMLLAWLRRESAFFYPCCFCARY